MRAFCWVAICLSSLQTGDRNAGYPAQHATRNASSTEIVFFSLRLPSKNLFKHFSIPAFRRRPYGKLSNANTCSSTMKKQSDCCCFTLNICFSGSRPWAVAQTPSRQQCRQWGRPGPTPAGLGAPALYIMGAAADEDGYAAGRGQSGRCRRAGARLVHSAVR